MNSERFWLHDAPTFLSEVEMRRILPVRLGHAAAAAVWAQSDLSTIRGVAVDQSGAGSHLNIKLIDMSAHQPHRL